MTPRETFSTALDRCLSPHVAMPQSSHVRLEWYPSGLRLHRTRVIAWTCHCRATVYELCSGGGQAFVRRILQLEDGHEIQETAPSPLKEDWALWMALLSEAAR
ncbi:hypothetical protein FHU36_001671 [Nonomuraea muscovyensis]|uniref:Uncharacterized protein n=1 Tax=Nonomuraea muscovyensis TaxID=1124761 RepID=A0A7X0BYB5_9ACTN|nr:hypothetical protein [Nonomuraea muscovyensis]